MTATARLSRILFPLALLLSACHGGDSETEAVRPAMVVRPQGDGVAVAVFSGEVRARQEPALAFRIGGKIARRLVDAGDRVKAGQPLAELDANDVRLQLEASRAGLASAQSDLALAKAERDRYQTLLDQQLISRSLFDTREAQFQAASARVRQARAQANASGNQASYAVLRAPQTGVIAQRSAEAGQVVAAGQTVFVLAADGERDVAISIPELQVAQFRPGRPLVVELWAAPGQRLPAKLREIAASADPATRTYAARVSFASGAMSADVGQSARVYAPGQETPGLKVPLSALVQDGTQAAVWVVSPHDARVHLTPVRIGAYGDDSVPVLSGLKPDDWIVAAGAHLLREGQTIKPVDRDNRPVLLGAAATLATASAK